MDKITMQLLDRVKKEITNRMFAQERGADSKGNTLHWKMRFAEDAVENIIHDIPIHTELFRFEFPYCQGYFFTLTKEDNDALVFTLNTPGKQYIARDDIEGYKKTSYEMAEAMKENGLYFAPAYNQAFERLLMGMIPGERISLKQGYRNPTGFRRWVKVARSGGLCYTCVMGTWKSKNRHKYLLQYHIIFVCKYRKKLLVSKQISDDIKQFSYEICQKHKVIIRYMETDKDHIHYMIETEPTMSISKIVNLMKSYTTYHIWKRYPDYLRKHFWKEHTFWTDGYFVCSVGNVSEEMLRKYIENQG